MDMTTDDLMDLAEICDEVNEPLELCEVAALIEAGYILSFNDDLQELQ